MALCSGIIGHLFLSKRRFWKDGKVTLWAQLGTWAAAHFCAHVLFTLMGVGPSGQRRRGTRQCFSSQGSKAVSSSLEIPSAWKEEDFGTSVFSSALDPEDGN